MRGAVAAGHPRTAEAGAAILAGGGNAVDACVAAGFVSWVVESPLTGPGAGGFMLVHRARDRTDRMLDFFVEVPGRGVPPDRADAMETVQVAFSDEGFQTFRVGAASCAVPGAVAGLAEAHRLYGTVPWRELLVPAIELARAGIELNAAQAFLHAILDPILRRAPEGRRIYGAEAASGVGERIPMDDLAATLARLADDPSVFYRGDLAGEIVSCVAERGGRITEQDLAAYRVVRRTPVRVRFRGHEFVSNPPPSAGGVLIGYALGILERLGRPAAARSPEALVALAGAMREATRARSVAFSSALHRGGLAPRLLAEESLAAAAARARAFLRTPRGERVGAPSTTHVSVVDAAGNAASLSASTGAGSGVVVPGTGIHLNNMLGEDDLHPPGARDVPGRRLSSMMAPSVVLANGRPRLVVGSAGSVRLRAAILQIVVNVVDHGLPLDEAIASARIHVEGSRIHAEPGLSPAAVEALEARGYELVRWRERNLYFGGAAAVAEDGSGRLEAAGDPRRGGAGIVVA